MRSKTWRVERPHNALGHRDDIRKAREIAGRTDISAEEKKQKIRTLKQWFPATRFFDNLSFIGDAGVGCIVLETSEGLIQFDCMNEDDYSIEVIEDGYRKLGLDINDLKAILISHGHGDHYGRASYYREKYGAKLYMSKVDYEFASGGDPFPIHPPMNYEVDGFIEGGDEFVLGDTAVKVFSTPGHTPGGLSFIFPVYDEGRPHTACIWGGTGAPRGINLENALARHDMYLKSVDTFTQAILENGVDVEISAHPFVDNAVQKLALCREIFDGIPNPFVGTTADVCRFMQMLRDRVAKHRAEIIVNGEYEERKPRHEK